MRKTITKSYFIKIFFRFLKENNVFFEIYSRIKYAEKYKAELCKKHEYEFFYSDKYYVDGINGFINRLNTSGIAYIFTARNILPFEYDEFYDYVDFNVINQKWRNLLMQLEINSKALITD